MNRLIILVVLIQLAYAGGDEHLQLEKGKVLTKMVDITGSHLRNGVVRGVIDATPETIFQVVTDYEHYKDFMPRGRASEIREKEENRIRYYSEINMPWPIADLAFDSEVRLSPNHRDIQFQMVPGTGKGVKQFEGSWSLEPFDGSENRTLVTYTILFESDRWYPRWAVNLGTKATLEKIIDAVRKRLRDRSIADQSR